MASIKTEFLLSKKSHKISIRSATIDDAEEMTKFDRSTLEQGAHFNTQPEEIVWLSQEQCIKRITRFQEEAGSLILLAEIEGQLIGTFEFRNGQRKATAHAGYFDMAIHPNWQNKGIGSLLIKSFLDWVNTHPTIEVVKLEVAEDNVPAVMLYKKFGFSEIGRDPFASKIDGKYQPELSMILKVK